MFFSIIIPTFNREKIISRAIKSVLAQTFVDFELLIIDDGSVDDTESVVLAFKNDKIKYSKTANFGVAHARNHGIKMASGKYVGFLDSDDLMETAHLETAYQFIQRSKCPEVVHLNFLWGLEDKSLTHRNILPASLPNDIFKSCSLHVNCIFIQAEIAKENLFNESRELMFAEDWDFFIKLSVRYEIHLLDATTAYLIDHENRSMRDFDAKKWIIRRDAIEQSITNDKIIKDQYFNKIKVVTSHMNSLIAINYAVRKSKKASLKYWTLAVSQNFEELFTKRTLAIAKHLIFTW